MIKIGTIIVVMERDVLVQAMRPKVQIKAISTEPAGINMPRRFLKKRKRIKAITKKVIGGSLKKSCSVYVAKALETRGIPIWYRDSPFSSLAIIFFTESMTSFFCLTSSRIKEMTAVFLSAEMRFF